MAKCGDVNMSENSGTPRSYSVIPKISVDPIREPDAHGPAPSSKTPMGHVHKRLASTAAKVARVSAVSTSHLKAFPPPDANKDFFDPRSWALTQPPTPAALTAFAHRIGLGLVLPDVDVVRQACTHPSFVTLHGKHYPEEPVPATNGNLASLGNSLMGLFASEYLNASYPHLPTMVFKAGVTAYVGDNSCAIVAREWGVTPLLRWHRAPPKPPLPPLTLTHALASVPRSLTALLYTRRSLPVARKFVHNFFLSREVDLRGMIKFTNPKKVLAETVRKFGRERCVSRLLKETGRISNSPVFVVGIYSGIDQLGEGFGSSLRMAEFRAAEDALHRLYLTRTPPTLLSLPSSTFPSQNPFDIDPRALSEALAESMLKEYVPGELGTTEVMAGSAGRSGMPPTKERKGEEGEEDEDEEWDGEFDEDEE